MFKKVLYSKFYIIIYIINIFDITKTNQKLYVRLSLGTCLVVQILASYNNTFYPEMFAPTWGGRTSTCAGSQSERPILAVW